MKISKRLLTIALSLLIGHSVFANNWSKHDTLTVDVLRGTWRLNFIRDDNNNSKHKAMISEGLLQSANFVIAKFYRKKGANKVSEFTINLSNDENGESCNVKVTQKKGFIEAEIEPYNLKTCSLKSRRWARVRWPGTVMNLELWLGDDWIY